MPWNNTAVASQILAVHAALVPAGPEGEVVFFGGDEHWGEQQESAGGGKWEKTRVYDVASEKLLTIPIDSPKSDVFCSHHAFAADGRLLIAGGTSKWPEGDHHHHNLDFLGHARCWVYRPRARRWDEVARMNPNPDQPGDLNTGGRWYPGCVTLGNGDVFACFGHLLQGDDRHRNTRPERYKQAANTWIDTPKVMAKPIPPNVDDPQPGKVRYLMYARVFTLPDGKLFFATPMPVEFAKAATEDGTYFSTRYDPATGDYVGHKIPEPGFGGYRDWSRPAVLLPLLPDEGYRPRVLFCGDTEALKIDLGDPTGEWKPTSARDPSVATLTRVYSNAAILPTGQVCLVGGVSVVNPEQGVQKAEIYTPAIDWSAGTYSLPDDDWGVDPDPAGHVRNYHSTALLLPNGKVWVAGGNVNADPGNPDVVGVKQIELYEPAYVGVANRIQITSSPRFAQYGSSIEIEIDGPATNVQRVALIRAGSVTHSTNNDQRYVGLTIQARNGNALTVGAPPHGNVAPPGYYMLWVVDAAGNPCRLAKFVRLGHVGCSAFTDRSTFSEEEILSLGGGGPATVDSGIYLYLDGFLDPELTGTPTFTLNWEDTGDPVPPSQITLVPKGRLNEVKYPDQDVPQRITFPFGVHFPNMAAWSSVVDRRRVRVTFTLGGLSCSQRITLTKSPNPYMTDISPAANNPGWLSTDIRVIALAAGQNLFEVEQGAGAGDGHGFIRAVLDKFNSLPNDHKHPYHLLPTGLEESPLVMFPDHDGRPWFNYAIARVRYRANTTVAQRVKVFFRMFNTVGTTMEYNGSTTYRHSGPGPNAVPLLGRAGDDLVSIPFFIGERVETRAGWPGATSMANQRLDPDHEIKDIAPTPGVEVTMYFGAWLDFNRLDRRFPLDPGAGDGPWPDAACASIYDHMRGLHQCLVTEVYFEPDETEPGETPSTSDNLSQRNLSIVGSDNPGGPDSHLAMHTFEVKPSSIPEVPQGTLIEAVPLSAAPASAELLGTVKRWYPDELFFHWHNLPEDAEVTLNFSDIDTAEIMRLAALRLSPGAFTAVDKHTITFRVADVASMPLPGGREANIPALLSVQLPDTVVYGETYRVSVQQVDGMTQQVIGAFQMTIPISNATLLVDQERRSLSVLKYIFTKIPTTDRWHPIFLRYLKGLGDKVDALGGDSGSVHGNPDGSGDPYVPPAEKPPGGRLRRCLEAWLVSLVLAVTLVLLGVVESSGAQGVIAVVGIVVLALLIRSWAVRCCGRIRCALLDHILLGATSAGGVLAVLLVGNLDASFLEEATAIAVGVAALAAIGSFVLRCRGDCCDDRELPCGGE